MSAASACPALILAVKPVESPGFVQTVLRNMARVGMSRLTVKLTPHASASAHTQQLNKKHLVGLSVFGGSFLRRFGRRLLCQHPPLIRGNSLAVRLRVCMCVYVCALATLYACTRHTTWRTRFLINTLSSAACIFSTVCFQLSCVRVCLCVCVCVCVCVYTHTHTHPHAHMRAHTYTHYTSASA